MIIKIQKYAKEIYNKKRKKNFEKKKLLSNENE